MENKRQTLGELIEYEVRKQGIAITTFADMICCQRSNVYDIFKRGDKIDTAQLKLISKVLGRNFFSDLANDQDLINLEDEEVKKDMKNRLAVSQFMEVMPRVLIKMNITPTIVFSQLDKVWGAELPDFGLADIPISFTIGQRLLDKMNEAPKHYLKVESFTSPSGEIVDAWINEIEKSVMIDIPILFHTEEEWSSIMNFAVNEVQPKYGILCCYGVPRIEREIAYAERKNL